MSNKFIIKEIKRGIEMLEKLGNMEAAAELMKELVRLQEIAPSREIARYLWYKLGVKEMKPEEAPEIESEISGPAAWYTSNRPTAAKWVLTEEETPDEEEEEELVYLSDSESHSLFSLNNFVQAKRIDALEERVNQIMQHLGLVFEKRD